MTGFVQLSIGEKKSRLTIPEQALLGEFGNHFIYIRNGSSFEDIPKYVLQIVGTYRLLRRAGMERIGRYYSESECDVSALKSYPGDSLLLSLYSCSSSLSLMTHRSVQFSLSFSPVQAT